ncbi:MAG: PQQ-dependent sugar dehydrogenase [Candidatus Zambryskibacteria bacterium]|nr:PQQ-dependent sugar dehydrogenase [Candidatus Zambryskibacteria bacterium]
MKKIIILVVILLILGSVSAPYMYRAVFKPTSSTIPVVILPDRAEIKILAGNLQVPWDIAILPDGNLLATERPGDLVLVSHERGVIGRTTVPDVSTAGEGGLMGIALHPNFETNNFIYLYRTTMSEGRRINQIVRFSYSIAKHTLSDAKVILDNIPGATYHDGGAISFGPDGYLYVTTGDAGTPALARDTSSLAGKTLRMTDDGSPAPRNLFGNIIYSFGHRNAQGLAWDTQGRLWQTEHGRSGVRSGLDELNLIRIGGDYGWPESQGDTVLTGTIGPMLHSGESDTWAPGSITADGDTLYFTGLRGQKLYRVTGLETNPAIEALLVEEYGRLRAARIFNNTLYLTTSNTDGRGKAGSNDDQLIAIPLELMR